jgi:antitoxin component YwqK of YwqJK toxin-antitoxin module
MKPLILILFLFFILAAFGQQPEYPDSGFTNKAEAKNLTVNGKKEGKWVEYGRNTRGFHGESDEVATNDIEHADFYYLFVYKDSVPNGLERGYYKNGKLYFTVFYKNGIRNGVAKQYFEDGERVEKTFKNDTVDGMEISYFSNGKIQSETPYLMGEQNGIMKTYDSTGRIYKEIPFTKGTEDGMEKEYQENGKLAAETLYKDGLILWYKEFDENGTEIKK